MKNTNIYFSSAKVFALTSLYEGLGNVFIDAVNHEIPCVLKLQKRSKRNFTLNSGGYKVKIKNQKDLNTQLLKMYNKLYKKLAKD